MSEFRCCKQAYYINNDDLLMMMMVMMIAGLNIMFSESSESKSMRSQSGLLSPHRIRCSTSKFKKFMILYHRTAARTFFRFSFINKFTNLQFAYHYGHRATFAIIRCDELRKRLFGPTQKSKHSDTFIWIYNSLFALRMERYRNLKMEN